MRSFYELHISKWSRFFWSFSVSLFSPTAVPGCCINASFKCDAFFLRTRHVLIIYTRIKLYIYIPSSWTTFTILVLSACALLFIRLIWKCVYLCTWIGSNPFFSRTSNPAWGAVKSKIVDLKLDNDSPLHLKPFRNAMDPIESSVWEQAPTNSLILFNFLPKQMLRFAFQERRTCQKTPYEIGID